MKNCPKCGKSFEDGKFCKFCGTELVEEEQKIYCSKCGAMLKAESVFCSKCGTKVEDSDTDNDFDTEQENNSAPMGKKETMAKVLGHYYDRVIIDWRVVAAYSYTSIDEKYKHNLLKFYENFLFDDFVYIYDHSLFHNAKSGIVFMLSGFYFDTPPFTAKFYIAYKDIEELSDYDDDFLVIKALGNEYKILCGTSYDLDWLKELINELIKLDKEIDTSYVSGVETGKVQGFRGGAGKRKVFFSGQKSGYFRASREYEIKFRRQADLFLEQKNKFEENRDEYIKLLDECKEAIRELQEQLAQKESLEYRERLQMFMDYQDKLENL